MENWFAVLNNHTSHKLADKQEIEDDLNFYPGKHVLACFLNNIYYNICSEGLKGRGTQREYSSKPLKHSIVKRVLVFKRWILAYFYPL